MQAETKDDLTNTLKDLETLTKNEYDQNLTDLLKDNDKGDLKLQRLTGVLIKRNFAVSIEAQPGNLLDAQNEWHWDNNTFEDPTKQDLAEFRLLKALRDDQKWGQGSWQGLIAISSEAGLFLVLGRWLANQITDDDKKSLRECYQIKNSAETEAIVSTIDTLFPATAIFASYVGAPAVALSLALIAAKYGLDKIFNSEAVPDT